MKFYIYMSFVLISTQSIKGIEEKFAFHTNEIHKIQINAQNIEIQVHPQTQLPVVQGCLQIKKGDSFLILKECGTLLISTGENISQQEKLKIDLMIPAKKTIEVNAHYINASLNGISTVFILNIKHTGNIILSGAIEKFFHSKGLNIKIKKAFIESFEPIEHMNQYFLP